MPSLTYLNYHKEREDKFSPELKLAIARKYKEDSNSDRDTSLAASGSLHLETARENGEFKEALAAVVQFKELEEYAKSAGDSLLEAEAITKTACALPEAFKCANSTDLEKLSRVLGKTIHTEAEVHKVKLSLYTNALTILEKTDDKEFPAAKLNAKIGMANESTASGDLENAYALFQDVISSTAAPLFAHYCAFENRIQAYQNEFAQPDTLAIKCVNILKQAMTHLNAITTSATPNSELTNIATAMLSCMEQSCKNPNPENRQQLDTMLRKNSFHGLIAANTEPQNFNSIP